MHKTLFLALVVASFPAHAGNGVQLDRFQLSGTGATGSCGKAVITLEGITQSDANGHANVISPGGLVSIEAGAKTLNIGRAEPFFLQDRTMLACLDTAKGKRLVVATFCDGRSCQPVEYLVLDPSKPVLPTQVRPEGCSLRCAEKVLGVRVPAPLRDDSPATADQ